MRDVNRMFLGIAVLALLAVSAVLASCGDDEYSDDGSDSGTDTDTDGGTDTDTDTDTDSDTDTDTDTSTDTDTDTDADTDTETETDTCTDTGCFEGDCFIYSSSDVAALEPYTCINGDLYVEYFSLAELVLPNLTAVCGTISLIDNLYLANLDLGALTSVGALILYNNPALSSLTGLSNLTTVSNGLNIFGSTALTSLDGLNNVSSPIAGVLEIYGNWELTSLDALSGIPSV